MKVIFTNVNPHKKFNKERAILIKLQIDNCLDNMGRKAEDIVLATNFDYEYRGVKSIVVDDKLYCDIDDRRYCFKVSTHILTINYLLQNDLLDKDVLHWYHDMDAYEQHLVTEEELGLENVDLGLTNYGWSPKWNLGSFFFKNSAKDIFLLLANTINERKLADERSMTSLIKEGKIDKSRYKLLDITYNFGMKHVESVYEVASKPLKVVHFHPLYGASDMPDTTMNIFRYGKNGLGMPLITQQLMDLFDRHGFGYPYGTSGTYGDFTRAIAYE